MVVRRTSVLDVDRCSSTSGSGARAAPAPFPTALQTSNQQGSLNSSVTQLRWVSLCCLFFPKFPRNLLQAVSPLLPPAAGLLRAHRAPPSPCLISSARAPDSSAETNLISGINKRVEMLIFAQKIRIFFFFGLTIHLNCF